VQLLETKSRAPKRSMVRVDPRDFRLSFAEYNALLVSGAGEWRSTAYMSRGRRSTSMFPVSSCARFAVRVEGCSTVGRGFIPRAKFIHLDAVPSGPGSSLLVGCEKNYVGPRDMRDERERRD